MARRIRSIKPEILDDEVTASLPHLEWRLFVSLWLLADDYGNLHGHAAQVKGAALWATDDGLARVRESLARLSEAGLIGLYTVRGQSYIAIRGWAKHQKVDHPGKPIIPGPDQADPETCTDSRGSREPSRESRESLATDQDQDQDQDLDLERGAPAVPAPLAAVRPGRARRKREPKPETSCPDDLEPSERQRSRAAELGVDVDQQFRLFRAHHGANGRLFRDWSMAFDKWIENAPVYSRPTPPGARSLRIAPLRGAAAAFANLDPE